MTAAYSLARDVPLHDWNTFHLDARAERLATVHVTAGLPALLAEPALRALPLMVLGAGSNVLFATNRFEGCLIHLRCDSIRIVDDAGGHALVQVDAGCEWDALVDWTLDHGLQGLENLALIPGQAGAAPIQNIGAYGVEVGRFIAAVHVYDRQAGAFDRLPAARCEFGYRDSVFKREPDRRIVTAIELLLPKAGATNLSYAGLREELAAMGGLQPTPRNVAAAVRRIRRRKLPDPAVAGNAGSFFKNPVVTRAVAVELQSRFAGVPVYPTSTEAERKLSAAWLIEQAGWRGVREGDAAMSAQHALVLVNLGRATGPQLLTLARRVAASVQEKFGVSLEPEPRIVGATFQPRRA
ncbi:MAG: UDP-N-acetylmuramate dehydrogenase [Steroidobacteraceae bacterium]|nr:UDP-N-acetylmuramate dehydrogenase [Steroidobacteraceae bacterium]MBP7013645.1 UDP-N-acetylmuramate dehydrogenase [Steroidobacteraceae bacterium]